MKTAILFYSLDGNCTFVARQIKNSLDADLVQLQTEDQKKRSFWGKMFWGGSMAVRGKKPPLKPYSFDPSAYDLLIIGAPVWAGFPAPPIQTFLSETSITGKKIALFVCHGGGKGKSLKKLKAMLPGNDIISQADFKYPVKNAEAVQQQIAVWVKELSEDSSHKDH